MSVLTPAGLLSAAAQIIRDQGLAREEYYIPTPGKRPRACPVDVFGALAVAADLEPDIWDGPLPDLACTRALYGALDALVEHLGLDAEDSYQETVGSWSDSEDPALVVDELRAASALAPGLVLVGSSGDRLVDGPNGGA